MVMQQLFGGNNFNNCPVLNAEPSPESLQ